MNRLSSSAPMPSPTRFRKKSSPSPVMSGAAITRATAPATMTRFCFHQGRFSGALTAASSTGS